MNRMKSVARLARRVVVSSAEIGVIAVGVTGGTTGAAPRTTSVVIATAADSAVSALDRWQQTRNPIDYVRFVQQRDLAAAMAEDDLEMGRGSIRAEWEQVALDKQEALLSAVSQLGVPYRSHTSKPGVGFDCSGLTIWAFGEAGLDLPRISGDQIRAADAVDPDEAEPGDLVYYPGHVSIYIGADMMVHSPNSGNHVEITDLPDRSLRFGDAASAFRAEAVESDH